MESVESTEGGEWKHIPKKYVKKEAQIPLKCYWNGFDNDGNEKWYIEFTNGTIITNKDSSYNFWYRKYFNTL